MHPIIAEELARQNTATLVSRAAAAAQLRDLDAATPRRHGRALRLLRHRSD